VAGQVAGGIGALGRRHAPQGGRAALGACDAAVGRRRRLAPRRARGAAKLRLLVSKPVDNTLATGLLSITPQRAHSGDTTALTGGGVSEQVLKSGSRSHSSSTQSRHSDAFPLAGAFSSPPPFSLAARGNVLGIGVVPVALFASADAVAVEPRIDGPEEELEIVRRRAALRIAPVASEVRDPFEARRVRRARTDGRLARLAADKHLHVHHVVLSRLGTRRVVERRCPEDEVARLQLLRPTELDWQRVELVRLSRW
jgi:hypothetical protein